MAPVREPQGPGRARARLLRPGPLAGRYPAVAAMVILFLVPYLVLSSALQPIAPFISGTLHLSPQAMSLASGPWRSSNASV